MRPQLSALREAVGVLVGAVLPRALRIAKARGDIGRHCEALVIGEFPAPISRQRLYVRRVARRESDDGSQPDGSDLGERRLVCAGTV